MKCLKCSFENISEARYCGMCGSQLAVICIHCNYANPAGYRYCVMCGAALETAFPPLPPAATLEPFLTANLAVQDPESRNNDLDRLEGERRAATVILADVKNSTDLMEEIGNEAWVAIMNHVFQVLEAEIYRFGGQVGQFRGDGLVAFFGAQSADEDDPDHAVRAGLAIQSAIQPYAADLKIQQGINLQLRIGIHTGEVIKTSIGEPGQYREENTAMGEAVAMAARMEASAQPGTVLVSAATYERVKSRFEWISLGMIHVKGISQPVAAYRPVRPISEIESPPEPGSAPNPSRLIGREKEFKILAGHVSDLCNVRGSIVMITGEKGMGKSFLVSQVRQHFQQRGMTLEREAPHGLLQNDPPQPEPCFVNLVWLRGICRSFEQEWPYSMWIDLFKSWLHAQPDEPNDVISSRLHEMCESLWGTEHDYFYPFLSLFLSLPLAESEKARIGNLSAEAIQSQIRVVVRSWVESLGQKGPVVFSFSDIHWADTSSFQMLEYCLPVSEDLPVLWLLMARSDRSSLAWRLHQHLETEYPHRLTDIVLQPLSKEDCALLIADLIGAGVLTPETRENLIQKSEGNPFYIQEMIHTLASQGVLVWDETSRTWRQARTGISVELPGSLQSLLLARLDRLAPGERKVLQVASVIGVTFWRNALESIVGASESTRIALFGLQRSQLIQERNPVPHLGLEYIFSSSLLRDVVYDSLLSAQKESYHLAVARYLEEFIDLEGGRQFDSLLAYHYRSAGEWRKELFYTLNAAEQSRQIFANGEALGHYNRAVELLDSIFEDNLTPEYRQAILSQRFEVLSGRRELYYRTGDVEAARADSTALLEIARAIQSDPALMVDALLSQPDLQEPQTKDELRESGLPMARQALDLARQISDRRREFMALLAIGQSLVALKEPGWVDIGEECIQIARELKDASLEVSILLSIANAYGIDNLERGSQYLQSAFKICLELDDKFTQIHLLQSISPQFEREGKYWIQLNQYELPRLQLSREVGDRNLEGRAEMFVGQIQGIYLGDYQAGLAHCEKAFHLLEKQPGRLYPLLRTAQMKAYLGDLDAAQACLDTIRPLVSPGFSDLGRAGFALVSCIYYNALGGRDHLLRVFDEVQSVREMVADNLISRQYHMVAACQMAWASMALIQWTESGYEKALYRQRALEASQSALGIYQQFGFVQAVECVSEEILYVHSAALRLNDHRDQSTAFLKAAHQEMMRKFSFIPKESPYRQTFLKNIAIHRRIQDEYKNIIAQGSRKKRKTTPPKSTT